MDFNKFRDHCKHEHPGYNIDRQLEYTCRHPADLRPCTVNGSQAFFHRWADEDRGLLKINVFTRPDERERLYRCYRELGIVPECCSIEALRCTVALVEMPDGSIKTVPATEIRFTDREG